ncbi:MAG TPA: hypothetical protein P5318_19980, partial [Candidatus Hydrogenedentes bacterium]|nr:hypothetical protein [Candidatus Hydrogenedentota bacterium]
KLDYNFATPEQIAQVLRDDWDMNSPANAYGDPANSSTANDPLEFARGLQQEGVNVSLDVNGVFSSPVEFGNPVTALYKADPYLRALQLGANLRDARDTGYGRSTAVMQVDDTWWDRMQVYDRMDNHGETFDQGRLVVETIGDHRKIVYTVAGIEGVRITEMMVRPVRRVEAEMERDDDTSSLFPRYLYQLAYNEDQSAATYQNNFDLTREQMRDKAPPAYLVTNQPEQGFWPAPKLSATSESAPANPCSGFLNPWLGPGTAISTQTRFVQVQDPAKDPGPNPGEDPPTEHWPNIMEFKFGPSKGLPPGRYYLKINTTDYRGRPTVSGPRSGTVDVPWYRNNEDPIRVAVKYVSSTGAAMPNGMTVGTKSIAQDVADGFAACATRDYPDDFYDNASAEPSTRVWKDYWTHYWRGPSDANGGVGLVLDAQSLEKADADGNGKVT